MDSATFLARLEAHKKILYKVAYLYGRGEADRQDLVQEIVAQLWRSLPGFDGRSQFSTWMYRVALNVAISQLRARTRRETVSLDDAAIARDALLVAAPDEGSAGVLAELVARLGELDRALVLLHLEGHAHDAIADILGLSATNVGTKLARIKQGLRADKERP
jgi:RNA polymerase sigma-70 factor (ECF subfamily)